LAAVMLLLLQQKQKPKSHVIGHRAWKAKMAVRVVTVNVMANAVAGVAVSAVGAEETSGVTVKANAPNALSVRVSKAASHATLAVKAVAVAAVAASALIARRVKMLPKTEHSAQIRCRQMAKMVLKMRCVSHVNHVKAVVVNAASAAVVTAVSARSAAETALNVAITQKA
jgi:hypothetical protein